ncbi:heterokaryon incompatibility protein-domain-containing protein, partial [Stachybotrys elegans]
FEMSRWHKPSCKDPDVSVQGETPHCRTCGCHWQGLVSRQVITNSPPPLPPDEPFGRMNLWWPRSVPYAKSKRNHQYKPLSSSLPSLQQDASHSAEKHSAEPVHSPIYGDGLATDEFRLVCLSAAPHEDFPVHLCLETYSQTECPEYETVSYTWGGEEGDSSLCKPIFVGPYWDVLFQTQNCWEMLRFIRPWRGIRMVWVDALCINQNNTKERGQQVAKMAQIYEQCSRVIVYLGADLILPLHGHFPARHRLHELEGDSIRPQLPKGHRLEHTRPSLRDILKRRYFSRVWVIQELVFPQRAIIRIGDVDFWTDSVTSTHLAGAVPRDWQWESTAAPWLQYMAQKALPVNSIYELLRITAESRATDPRDRLFGVVGLLQNEDARAFQPDYSLSAQHFFIGLFAHFIINMKALHLFQWAAGLSAPASSPSWIPDWRSSEPWSYLLMEPLPEHKKATNSKIVADFIKRDILKISFDPMDRRGVLFSVESHSRDLGSWDQASPESFRTVSQKRPWNRDIAVDADTGALSAYLTHFCTVSTQPVLVGKLGTLGIFKMRGATHSLFLTAEIPLNAVARPGCDHIFILDSGNSTLIYLILRQLDSPKTYKMVVSCPHLFLGNSDKIQFLDTEIPLPIQSFQRSLYDEIERTRSMLYGNLPGSDSTALFLRGCFPGVKTGWEVFSAYRGILNEQDGSSTGFETSYLSCIDARFHPRVINGFLELKFEPVDWDAMWDNYIWRTHVRYMDELGYPVEFNNPWELRWWKGWKPIFDEWDSLQLSSVLPIKARLRCDAFLPLARIQRALLKKGPGAEHHFIGCPDGLYGIRDDFNIYGSTYQIHIV